MKPCISFDDVSLTPVDKTSYRYDQKRKKDVKLKKPVIKKSKSIHIGDCHDLFELIRQLDFHTEKIDKWEDYIEVNFKLRAIY
tara:strand:+ start:712 stop:960 length:249 start_codon:yes stop_codon:yes gene_type:complete